MEKEIKQRLVWMTMFTMGWYVFFAGLTGSLYVKFEWPELIAAMIVGFTTTLLFIISGDDKNATPTKVSRD